MTPATAEVAKVRREASSITSPVLNTASTIVIVDSTSYAKADETLSRVREAKRQVTEKFEEIIKPIYNGLQLLYKFRKDLADPLELAESQIKSKMAIWHTAERRRVADENAAKEAERVRLQKQIDDKNAKALAATRQSVRTALTNATTELSQRLVDVESQPEATVAKVEHSKTRVLKKALVVDRLALLKAVVAGEVPMDIVSLDVTKAYRESPATVETWPGVKISEEVQIVGR